MITHRLNKDMLVSYGAALMVYFEKHKLSEVLSSLLVEVDIVRPDNAREWMGENIKRIADDVYVRIRNNSYVGYEEFKLYRTPGRYLNRIVIFGRRGSGRSTQAYALIKEFDVVLINAENIIHEGLQGSDEQSLKLQQAYAMHDLQGQSLALGKLLLKRMLQMDSLNRGWILINYPNSAAEFHQLMEENSIPPNKIIYLKCTELQAKRRLLNKPLGGPHVKPNYIEMEMAHFNANEEAIVNYLSRRHEVAFIDGTNCYETVKLQVLTFVRKHSYLLGFNDDTVETVDNAATSCKAPPCEDSGTLH